MFMGAKKQFRLRLVGKWRKTNGLIGTTITVESPKRTCGGKKKK